LLDDKKSHGEGGGKRNGYGKQLRLEKNHGLVVVIPGIGRRWNKALEHRAQHYVENL
jgi:hypothetical protein